MRVRGTPGGVASGVGNEGEQTGKHEVASIKKADEMHRVTQMVELVHSIANA